MKTKKILSFVLAAVMMLSLATTSFAANITTNGGSQNVTVSYGLSQSFTVIIPETIQLDETGVYETVVAAEDVFIPYGKLLNVVISSENSDELNWYLVDTSDDEGENDLRYGIDVNNEGEFNVLSGDSILSVEAGTLQGETDLTFQLIDTPTKAGVYSGTLTFTVFVEDFVELISFTVDGHIYYAEKGMTWKEWVDSTYNPTFICPDCGDSFKAFMYENDEEDGSIYRDGLETDICAKSCGGPDGIVNGALKTSEIENNRDYVLDDM